MQSSSTSSCLCDQRRRRCDSPSTNARTPASPSSCDRCSSSITATRPNHTRTGERSRIRARRVRNRTMTTTASSCCTAVACLVVGGSAVVAAGLRSPPASHSAGGEEGVFVPAPPAAASFPLVVRTRHASVTEADDVLLSLNLDVMGRGRQRKPPGTRQRRRPSREPGRCVLGR